LTGRSVADLVRAAKEGAALWEGGLFLNDHEERIVRAIVAAAERAKVGVQVFEMEPSEDLSSSPLEKSRIHVKILNNILDEASTKRRTEAEGGSPRPHSLRPTTTA